MKNLKLKTQWINRFSKANSSGQGAERTELLSPKQASLAEDFGQRADQTLPVYVPIKPPSELVVEGFVAKRLEPQSGSVRFLHSFPRIGKADSEETDQLSDQSPPQAKLASDLVVRCVPHLAQNVCPQITGEVCEHEFITDWIDIDPDRSQTICYCVFCFQTKFLG